MVQTCFLVEWWEKEPDAFLMCEWVVLSFSRLLSFISIASLLGFISHPFSVQTVSPKTASKARGLFAYDLLWISSSTFSFRVSYFFSCSSPFVHAINYFWICFPGFASWGFFLQLEYIPLLHVISWSLCVHVSRVVALLWRTHYLVSFDFLEEKKRMNLVLSVLIKFTLDFVT